MKKTFRCLMASALVATTISAVGVSTGAAPAAAAPVTYTWTGGPQIYVVPAGVTSIDVTLRGAAGRSVPGGGDGGLGATVTGTLEVTPGQGIQVNVGGTGQLSGYGGFNGGGIGGGGGGGASDIRVGGSLWDSCPFLLNCGTGNRWAVAGGGGAGGAGAAGADGGGGGGASDAAAGTAAGSGAGSISGGGGATQSGTGSAGTSSSPTLPATAGAGATGGRGCLAGSGNGGGGGGGLFGGGGGGCSTTADSGGGGGSSLVPTGGSATAANNSGNGSVTISVPSAVPNATVNYNGGTGTDGSPQLWTVPSGWTSAYVGLYGAAGNTPTGGRGGIRIFGPMATTPGQVYQVNVGGQGVGDGALSDFSGGWNGGGDGTVHTNPAGGGQGGGGGATDLRVCGSPGSCTLAQRIAVAGGQGGNGGFGTNGGTGGYPDAENGQANHNGGKGATTTAGGDSGGGTAQAGSLGVGGNGGEPGASGSGGGGGGLYGGGGGNGGAGGGGSSLYLDESWGAMGTNVGNGAAVFLPMPTPTTGTSTATQTGATLRGTVVANHVVSNGIFQVAESEQDLLDDNAMDSATATPEDIAGTTVTPISYTFDDDEEFEPGTRYYYRACAENPVMTSPTCGEIRSFVVRTGPATVPTAPLDPAASGSGSSAVVTWDYPEDDGGAVVTSYQVQAYVNGVAVPGKTCTASEPTHSCTVTGLTSGTTYTFKVDATNEIGTGPESVATNPITPESGRLPCTLNVSARKSGVIPMTGRTVLVRKSTTIRGCKIVTKDGFTTGRGDVRRSRVVVGKNGRVVFVGRGQAGRVAVRVTAVPVSADRYGKPKWNRAWSVR